jgi:hypothetical protein
LQQADLVPQQRHLEILLVGPPMHTADKIGDEP